MSFADYLHNAFLVRKAVWLYNCLSQHCYDKLRVRSVLEIRVIVS